MHQELTSENADLCPECNRTMIPEDISPNYIGIDQPLIQTQ